MKNARVHLIGIGGIGLSAIARVLLEEGYCVSGSDLKLSPITDALAAQGATIYQGHRAENVGHADLVIVSSAIPADNPEAAAARARGVPVVKRDWLLGRMMEGRFGIAVAGSHGKTTITAMIALFLTEAGLAPTFIVGGILENLGTNARAGRGEHFVVEADEYDRTFLGLRPRIAVVTNIEMDHPDCYPELDDLVEAFREFLHLVPADGCIIGCGDEERVRGLLEAESWKLEVGRVVTYGLGEGVDWQAVDIRSNELGGHDFVALHDGQAVGEFELRIPGLHNVQNSLAVLAVAHRLGLDLAGVGKTLRSYRGVQRRFEVKGEVQGIVAIDDYAHHPTQIRTTLRAARERYPGRAIWVVFQPHTYSRTKALLGEFAESFADADHVVVTEIYAAREFDDLGVSASDIVARMRHPDARYISDLSEAAGYMLGHLKAGDVFITLGAGDGYKVGKEVLAELGRKNEFDQVSKSRSYIAKNEPMSLHTSFRIGGPADLYAVATSAQELVELVSLARERDMPYLIIGRGTNVLVADEGIRGLVIENGGGKICFENDAVLYAESGVLLGDLARESARRGLGGLEWAVGIPGSVGGAIVGNAGAYSCYIGDVTRKATVLAPDGTVRHLSVAEMGFGYRTSRFKGQVGKGEQEVILSAEFALRPEPAQALVQKMTDYTRRREASQPTEPSVGSIFKRTKQYPAGFLIEQAGLKGTRIGAAQISPKHANFIVNLGPSTDSGQGKARAADVKALIDLIQERVRERFGVELELEIELIGEWNG